MRTDEFMNGKVGVGALKAAVLLYLESGNTRRGRYSLCPRVACGIHAWKQETGQEVIKL